MHVRYPYLSFLLLISLCAGGLWWQKKQLYGVQETSLFSSCTKDPSAPLCVLEDLENQPIEKISSALPSITPPEFAAQERFSKDWISLVLFPHIEYAIVQRCVF